MPTVVYQKPDPFTGAANTISGALEGRAAGQDTMYKRSQAEAAAAEDTRRFDVGTANAVASEATQLREGQRQFDANDLFKRDHLQFLRDEGILTRELEDKLNQRNLTSEENRTEWSLASAERQNKQDNISRRYATTKQAQADQSRLALQRTELQSDANKLDFAQTIRGKYGDPNVVPYSPEIEAQIKQEARDRFLGPGTTTGQQDVVQATPEQIAAIDRMAMSTIHGYENLRTKVVNDTVDFADKKGRVETEQRKELIGAEAAAAQNVKDGVGIKGGFRLDEIYDLNENAVDSLSGQRLLSSEFYSTLTNDQAETMASVDAYIEQTATDAASLDDQTWKTVSRQAERRVKEMFDSPEWQNAHPTTAKTVREYYLDRLALAMENASTPPVPATATE